MSGGFRNVEVSFCKTTATMRIVGPSSDHHTNKWAVTCECGNGFSPSTTMFAVQRFYCPKCNREYQANYNETPPSIKICVQK